ncbi:MAG: aldehyde ferredoxin oxidoreductase C-terminal domain-containing protein, partial [Dehalococcoidales bacterium]|nr:aldehyde ferredoxin oxidoreductase C-terminal domain-containing protein [Dehalococcoidales bacterium]
MVEFLDACHRGGILDERHTALPLSRIGSAEFIERLTRMVALKEGFGELLSRGLIDAAAELGREARALLPHVIATPGSEKKDYDPRLLIITALIYATEPRRCIQQLHEVVAPVMAWLGGDGKNPGAMFSSESFRRYAEKAWGSAVAADFSTFEGKALAAKLIQDRVYARECLVVCDLRWSVSQVGRVLGPSPDRVRETDIFTAVTGRELDWTELTKLGERIFNLQRAIFLRDGRRGRPDDTILEHFFTVPLGKNELFYDADCLVPGRDGAVISRAGAVLDREQFEAMKTEYYQHRGWDAASGLPRASTLGALGLNDIAAGLAERGLVK